MAAYLEAAIEIAREAGALVSNFAERRIPFELKGDFDLVTEADRASEKLIVERLITRFPTHAILGEESGDHANSSEYRWYVDPVDGTREYGEARTDWAVHVALAIDGKPVIGAVGLPGLGLVLRTDQRGIFKRPSDSRLEGRQRRRRAGGDWLSEPSAAREYQHSLLLPTGDDHPRCAPRRGGRD